MSLLESNARQKSTLWHNNTVVVQLLGLSPVLAVSTSAINGLVLGIATALVLLFSCAAASLYGSRINQTWRLLWFLCIMAFFTTLIDLFLQWQYFFLYSRLGIYVPLICCNSAIFVRMEIFSRNNKLGDTLLDAAATGTGFLGVIITLAITREFLSTGMVFKDFGLLVPLCSDAGLNMSAYIVTNDLTFITLAPGALISLGVLIAIKNFIDRKKLINEPEQSKNIEPAERARVTNR
jgi:electron transport complex protein RnfE